MGQSDPCSSLTYHRQFSTTSSSSFDPIICCGQCFINIFMQHRVRELPNPQTPPPLLIPPILMFVLHSVVAWALKSIRRCSALPHPNDTRMTPFLWLFFHLATFHRCIIPYRNDPLLIFFLLVIMHIFTILLSTPSSPCPSSSSSSFLPLLHCRILAS